LEKRLPMPSDPATSSGQPPTYNGFRPPTTPATHRSRRWAESLLAILGGNVVFLLLEPNLPASLQHQTFRVDWGLGLDFLLCALLYGVIRWARILRPG
jgi:hypothetical protein